MRLPLSAFLSALFPLVVFAADAHAEPAFCGALRAELVALGGSGGGRQALAGAQAEARRGGCYGLFRFFGRGPSPACGGIMARVNRLARTAQPASFGILGFFSSGADLRRANLKQQMAQAGCASSSGNGGTLRTLCVRKCDGYYFPINSAATRKRLAVDQRICESMYPPGQASLYTQRYSGQTEGDMTSLAGESYAKQPFALLYRANYDHGCAASLQNSSTERGAVPLAAVKDLVVDFSPPQSAVPQIGDEASFTDSRVRIVGPVSYYALADPLAPVARATPPARVPGFVLKHAVTAAASNQAQ
jgi:hypothetical protein